MTIYKQLEKDHNKQRDLIASLKSAEPGSDRLSSLWTERHNITKLTPLYVGLFAFKLVPI